MCHPAVAIGFSILQTFAQQQGQKKQGKAVFGYQVDKQRRTIASAADAARHQYQGVLDRTMQVRAAATQDVNNQLRAYQEGQGRARASTAAGGLLGATVEEAGLDFARQFVEARTSRLMNLTWEENQLLASAQGIYAQQRARTEATTFAPVAGPNRLAGVAQIGASIANTWVQTQGHSFWGGEAPALNTPGEG